MLRFKLVVFIIICLLIWQLFRQFPYLDSMPKEDKFTAPIHNILENDIISAPVKVSVYYEALCPDSRNFILKQLVPTFEKAERLIDIELIPYGKAETRRSGNTYEFKCQHSHVECEANKIHACVIDLIFDKTAQLKYVACMIGDNTDPEEAGKRCAKELSLDYAPINKCAISQKGSLLLKQHGDKTHALGSKVGFIPTVLLDNSEDISSLPDILKDLFREVCNHFSPNTPNECNVS